MNTSFKSLTRLAIEPEFSALEADTYPLGHLIQPHSQIHHPNIGEPLLFGHLYYEEKAESWTEMWCVIPASSPQTCLCYKAKMVRIFLFVL